MSSSKPETCIYLTDTKEMITQKLKKAYTGAVSSLEGHRELGAIPEIDSCFQILRYHHPSVDFVNDIYNKYKKGEILTSELKAISIDFTTKLVSDIQEKSSHISENEIDQVLFKEKISSI